MKQQHKTLTDRMEALGATPRKTRSTKFSRRRGSQRRPSSSTGNWGKAVSKVSAKRPRPVFDGAPPRGLYTFTRSMPQLGESFLSTYPHKSSFSNAATRRAANRDILSVWSAPLLGVMRRLPP